MVLEQEEYNKLVIAAYKKKRIEKRLSLLLANPTRAQIRTACIHRYQERTSESDDRMLSDFFRPDSTEDNFSLLSSRLTQKNLGH